VRRAEVCAADLHHTRVLLWNAVSRRLVAGETAVADRAVIARLLLWELVDPKQDFRVGSSRPAIRLSFRETGSLVWGFVSLRLEPNCRDLVGDRCFVTSRVDLLRSVVYGSASSHRGSLLMTGRFGVGSTSGNRLRTVGVGVMVAALAVLAAGRADAGSMYVHSATGGAFANGRLTLHGVGRNVTWVSTGASTGVTPTTLVLKRLFSHKRSATGVLDISGKRHGQAFAFSLSAPRYNAARRAVTYRATSLTKRTVGSSAATAVPRHFGAASLSVQLASPLEVSAPGALSSGSGDNGGNDCALQITNNSNQGEQIFLLSSSQWDTDEWDPAPPETMDFGDVEEIESVGGLARGCHLETVWGSDPPGTNPGQATITIDVTWKWTELPTTSCTTTNPGLYRCERSDNGRIGWTIQPAQDAAAVSTRSHPLAPARAHLDR
jgi:hypothetical protein